MLKKFLAQFIILMMIFATVPCAAAETVSLEYKGCATPSDGGIVYLSATSDNYIFTASGTSRKMAITLSVFDKKTFEFITSVQILQYGTTNLKIEAMHVKGDYLYVVFNQSTGGDPCIKKYYIKEINGTLKETKSLGIRPKGVAYIDDDFICRTDSGYQNITFMYTDSVSNKAAIGISDENAETLKAYTYMHLYGDLLFAATSKTVFIYDAQKAKNGVSKQDVQLIQSSITPDSSATISGIRALGNYLYVATTKGTYIIDISNPKDAKNVGKVPLLGSTSAIEINNGYLYASYGNDLFIFSLADGKSPVKVYQDTLKKAGHIHLRPGKVYLSSPNGVLVYDASGIEIKETTQKGTTDSDAASVTYEKTLSGIEGVSNICSDGGYLFALSSDKKTVKVYKNNGNEFVCDIYKEKNDTKLDILNIEAKNGYLYVSYDGVYRKYRLSDIEAARSEEETVPLYSDTAKNTSGGVAVSDKYIFVALTETVREYVANYKIAVFDKTTGEYITSTWVVSGNASYDLPVRKMWVYGNKLYVSYNTAKTVKSYSGALRGVINGGSAYSPLVSYDISNISKGATLSPTIIVQNKELANISHPYNRGGTSYLDEENNMIYQSYYESDGTLSYKVYSISGTKPALKRTLKGGSKDCVEFMVKDGCLYEILQNNAGLIKTGSTTVEFNQVKVYDISDTTKLDLQTLLKGTYQTELYGDKTLLSIEADSQNIYIATSKGVDVLDKNTLKRVSVLSEGNYIYSIGIEGKNLFVTTSNTLYIYDTSDLSATPLKYSTGTVVRDTDVNDGKIYTSAMPQCGFGEVLSFENGVIKKVNSLKFDEFITEKAYKGDTYTLIRTEDKILVYNSSSCLKVGEITETDVVEDLTLSGGIFYTLNENTVSAFKVPTSSKTLSSCKASELAVDAEINGLVAFGNFAYVYTKDGIKVLKYADGVLSEVVTLSQGEEISAVYANDEYIYSAQKTSGKIAIFGAVDYKLKAIGDINGDVSEILATTERIFTSDSNGKISSYRNDGVVVNYNPDVKTPAQKTITVKTEDRGFPYVTYENRIFSAHSLIEANENYVVTAGLSGFAVYDENLNKLNEKSIKSVSGLHLSENKIVLTNGSTVYMYEISESGELTQSTLCSGLTGAVLFADDDKIFVYDPSGNISIYSWEGELQKELENLEASANKIYYKDGFLYVILANAIKLYDIDGTYKSTINAITEVSDIEAIGDYIYTSGSKGTAASNYLRTYNLAKAKAGEEETPPTANSYSTFVAVTGGRIPAFERCGDFLVADAMDSNEIQIINLKTRNKAYREGFLEKEVSYSYSDMDIANGIVYCISESGGIFTYNLFATDITDIEFVSDGISTKTPTGKETKARVKIYNESGNDFTGKLVLSVYEGNEAQKLFDVVTEDVVAKNGVETVIETETLNTENINDLTIKAFLFESLESLKPVCVHQTSFGADEGKVTIHVDSESTSSEEDGSAENPYKSIESAKQRVREINKSMTDDITVLISGGRYELSKPLVFTEEDGGFNGFDVIYKAKDNETPIISGGKKIDGFTLYDEEKGIYVADAKGVNSRNLNVNGERAVRARSDGNFKNAQISGDIGIYCYNEELADYKNIKDLEVVFCQDFMSKRVGVDSVYKIDSNGKMLVAMNRPFWQYQSYGSAAISYYENALELLDKENEFYIDTKADKVYYKPKSGVDMETAEVYAAVLENLITVEGSGLYKKAKNITFSGIEFTDATWMAPSRDGGFFPSQAGRYYGNMNKSNIIYFENCVTDAITVKNAHDITIDSCTLKNLGGYGIGITHAANDISVTNNTIKDISGGGVLVGEINRDEANPEDVRKRVYNVNVENNYIINTACEYYSSCAVAVGAAQNISVLHNEIANNPYSAVHIGWGWDSTPSRNITGLNVKYNYIHDVMYRLGDGGAIYTTGYTLADSVENPNNISENYIERMDGKVIFAGAAIYLDTGSNGYLIEKNVVDLRDNNSAWVPKWSTGNANNIFKDNYSTTSYTGAKNVSNTTVSYEADWNDEAKSIIENAGVIK